jgi:hypothetical protein
MVLSNMSKFITPITCPVENEEQALEVGAALEQLGYTSQNYSGYSKFLPYVVTNYAGKDNFYGFHDSANDRSQEDGVHLKKYNKDLILALAAMREGTEFFIGEMVVRTADEHCGMNVGNIATIESNPEAPTLKEYKSRSGGGTHACKNLRKATAAEILNYFTNKQSPVDTKETAFPEKWAILRTDRNYRVINEWFEQHHRGSYSDREYYLHNVPGGGMYDAVAGRALKPGYTEITFEQFQEHVLNIKPEMKGKIIGYKSLGVTKSKEEWETFLGRSIEGDAEFTPVYEEQFKEGDFVWAINDGGNGLNSQKEPEIVQIVNSSFTEQATGLMHNWTHVVQPIARKHYYNVNAITAKFRKATTQEVEEALSVEIGGYRSEFVEDTVKFGCQTISKEEVQALYKWLNKSFKVEVSIENTPITKELLQKILKRLS